MKKLNKKSGSKIAKNTTMLMIFQVAKIIFPFVTLPYLTRTLSTDAYGGVAYVKTIMNYMQIFVDFGFMLSGTKAIVKMRDNKKGMAETIGDIMVARLLLGLVGFLAIFILALALPLLRANFLYTILSYITVFLSIFLMDFVFRGIEEMQVIAARFILMRAISTVCVYIFVKSDAQMLLIPIFDILSSIAAIFLVIKEVKKRKITFKFTSLKSAWVAIKDSFTYFFSDMAATSFNALSTVVMGFILSASDIAYWSVCMQVIGSIQACYGPITGGIYPEMIRTKKWSIIRNTMKIFLPIVTVGCVIVFMAAPLALRILGGEEYLVATPILRILIPCLLFGFCGVVFGWPALGAVDKAKQVTKSTLYSIGINIILLAILIITNNFNLMTLAIVRTVTDLALFLIRYMYCKKFKGMFLFDEKRSN